MKPWTIQIIDYHFWAILAILGLCVTSWSGTLAEDSVRFAEFWTELEKGDSARAIDNLFRWSPNEGIGCGEQLSNFLVSWVAFGNGNDERVLASLDLGVPLLLADHAKWLRASALNRTGKSVLAGTYWKGLADDSASVHSNTAGYYLALEDYDRGEFGEYLRRVQGLRSSRLDDSLRTKLEVKAALILARQGSDNAAVDILWRLASSYPNSPVGSEAQEILQNYSRRFGHTPRLQRCDEIETELKAYETASAFSAGLKRVETLISSATGRFCEETLLFYRGRFQSALSRHHDALVSLQDYLSRFKNGRLRLQAHYFLSRSAYLKDADTVALESLAAITKNISDTLWAEKALDLCAVLHLDRGRPRDAVVALSRRCELVQTTVNELDCLWKLAWAQWEAGERNAAAETWLTLAANSNAQEYRAGSWYWASRCARELGVQSRADSLMQRLQAFYPYSYYAVLNPRSSGMATVPMPLAVPTLQELWESGGVHSRKFALLAAMRVSDLALLEWPFAFEEQGRTDGMNWWKAQLLLWQGDRGAAWRVVLRELGVYIRSGGIRPPSFSDLCYPLDYETAILPVVRRFGLDPYLAFGVICQESHFQPNAVSGAGAVGLMQLMPETAKLEARHLGVGYRRARLFDPEYNVQLGISHLARLLEEFKGDIVLSLAAYNAGKEAVRRWRTKFGETPQDEFVERIPYRETRLFVKRVVEHVAAYRRLHPEIANVETSH